MKRTAVVCVASLLWFAGFTIATASADEKGKLQLKDTQLGATPNVHSFGPTLLCGQPKGDALKIAKQRGIKVAVSLRQQGEVGWDEAAAAQAAGLKFQRIAFRAPDTLNDKVFAAARKALSDAEGQPVMLYCGSANRVGAIWAAHRALDAGLSVDDAIKEGRRVGMKGPYEPVVIEYIRRNKK